MGIRSWWKHRRATRRMASMLADARGKPMDELVREGGWDVLARVGDWVAAEDIWQSYSVAQKERAYRLSSVIYACVRKIAGILPDARMEFGTWDGDEWNPDPDHPGVDLLRHPNPQQDWRAFDFNVGQHLLLTGKSYVWKRRVSVAGFVEQLHAFPTSWVSPATTAHGKLTHYDVHYGGAAPHRIPPEDMIVWRMPDPSSPSAGAGPLQAALRDLQIDDARAAMMIEIMTNTHFAGTVLRQKDPWTTEQMNEMRSVLRDVIGPGKRGQPLFVGSEGEVEFPEPKADMDWPGTANLSESRICCLPGTMVLTKRGVVPIEDVRVGDMVITHRGRWRPVTGRHKNPVYETAYALSAKGFDTLRVTGGHPIYAGTYSQNRKNRRTFEGTSWIAARDVRPHKGRGLFHAMVMPPAGGGTERSLRLSSWVHGTRFLIEEKNDKLVSAYPLVRPIPASIPLSAVLGRIVGFYLAEGSQGGGKVRFSFHKNERAYQRMVVDDIKTIFDLDAKIVKGSGDNVLEVVCQNALLAELLSCGTARTKIVPTWAWDGPRDFLDAMLWAWSVGDGSYAEEAGSHRVSTVSESLAWQMRAVAISCGHTASLRRHRRTDNSVIQGREVRTARYSYCMTWRTRPPKQNGAYDMQSGYVVTAVQEKKHLKYDGPVFNLDVHEDNSYFTTGGTVHNCAAFGVPPILIGLRAGLERSTFSNFEESNRSFYQTTMRGYWQDQAGVLEHGLLRSESEDDGTEMEADWDHIPQMQEEADKIHDRALKDFHGGVITLNRALEMIGEEDVGDDGDVRVIPMNLVEYLPGAPETVPAAGAPGDEHEEEWEAPPDEEGEE